MIRIISFKIIPGGYQVTVNLDGVFHTVDSFWDRDGKDKVIINQEVYEIVDFQYLKKGMSNEKRL
jgi:hypothetical protein